MARPSDLVAAVLDASAGSALLSASAVARAERRSLRETSRVDVKAVDRTARVA